MLPVIFLQIVITVTVKCTYIIGTFLQRLDCLCTKSPSTDFPVFAWDVCYKRKTLRWSIGVVHARSVSSRRRLKNCVFGVHPSGGRKDRSRRVLNRDCREDERGQSTPLLQLPRLCADWWALWRYFVVWISLMSARIAVSGLWHFCPTFLHYHKRRWPWLYLRKSSVWIFLLLGDDWCLSTDCLVTMNLGSISCNYWQKSVSASLLRIGSVCMFLSDFCFRRWGFLAPTLRVLFFCQVLWWCW